MMAGRPAEEPKMRIYIDADEEYYFPKNLKKSNISVSGASCTSVKISEDLGNSRGDDKA